MSDLTLDIVCATRGDHDGENLSGLSDIVFSVMTDDSKIDGKRRIPFYNKSTHTVFGALLVQEIRDGAEGDAPDRTKFKVLNCRIRWVAKA